MLVGVAASVLLAEGAVRLLGAAPEVGLVPSGGLRLSENPRIGYEPVPGVGDGERNHLGYRDREHDELKPAGVRRVVVLGDSIAHGNRIERFSDTFPAVVERALDAPGRPVEVLSFAVPGYNTLQEVETLAVRGLAFDPDVVLLAYCRNDRWRADAEVMRGLLETGGDPVTPRSSWIARAGVHSALYRFVRFRVRAAGRGARDREAAYEALARDSVDESFRTLAGLAREHGFRVLVAVFPFFDGLEDEGREHADETRRLRELSRASGFAFLDLRPALSACAADGDAPVALDRLHPSAVGHACAGAAMAAALEPLLGTAG